MVCATWSRHFASYAVIRMSPQQVSVHPSVFMFPISRFESSRNLDAF
jgi:hypothetical protein